MTSAAPALKPRNPMLDVIARRDFRLLWIGQGMSFLGDQFHGIAAPWLVLKLTNNDPLALGTIMALAGIPRVIFMFLGGAISDRFSPRAMMLITDVVRLALVSLLAVLVITSSIQVWMLYVISILVGIASGLFAPAANSIVPVMVEPRQLSAGNSVFQGTAQLSQFVGPALAGGMIAWFARQAGGGDANMTGMGIAFAIDALSFLVSVITLWMMPDRRAPAADHKEKMVDSLRAGVNYVWSENFMRVNFIVIALANLIFVGPLLVGIPLLAKTRLAEGAAAYGVIMSAYAGGNLLGILAVGALPKPKPDSMRIFVCALLAGFGLALAVFGWVSNTWIAFAVLFVLGIGNGYLGVTLITALQKRAPSHLLGRLMGLMLVFNTGLVPLSQALSGAVIRWSLTGLFVIAGAAMLVLSVWSFFQPELKELGSIMSESPVVHEA